MLYEVITDDWVNLLLTWHNLGFDHNHEIELGDARFRPLDLLVSRLPKSIDLIGKLHGYTCVGTLAEDSEREGLLFAGTEFGMFVSFDGGARWQSLQRNLPVTPVTGDESKSPGEVSSWASANASESWRATQSSVITSYSIHYTKLYEIAPSSRSPRRT